jgi:septum formation protein
MQQIQKIILASKSPYRAQILSAAGIEFEIHPASLDERFIEESMLGSDFDVDDVADVLAQTKAMSVSEEFTQAWVIGSDQTLTLEGQLFHKPKNMEEARRRLLLLSGKTHQLNSAIALAKDGKILWHYSDKATIKFRELSPEFIGRHLSRVGEVALTSIGAYQIEAEGIQLFENIEGEYFSIMGMPIIPLLNQLRQLEIIDG